MINRIFHKNLLTAAFLTGCFFMCACENDVNEVRELGRRRNGVEEGKDMSIFLSMNGKMRAHLTAPLLLRYQADSGKKAEFPNTLHVDFYNDSARIESKLNAKYGRYMETENKVYLRDSVVAFNMKGDTLFCEDLYWDQNIQKFYTDKKVILSKNYRATLLIGVNGMKASQDLNDITLFNMREDSYATVSDSAKNSATGPGVAPIADTTKKNKPQK